jgi:hypothetical protein
VADSCEYGDEPSGSGSTQLVTYCFRKYICVYIVTYSGSISQWKFITLRIQYTTLDYGSQLF